MATAVPYKFMDGYRSLIQQFSEAEEAHAGDCGAQSYR
ncbi:hypothetical protein Y888_01665 [Mixta calida B021323]|nr:hypothetical protein Y888_01665 [Mixta calida B021323]